jgi:hypothetical protein
MIIFLEIFSDVNSLFFIYKIYLGLLLDINYLNNFTLFRNLLKISKKNRAKILTPGKNFFPASPNFRNFARFFLEIFSKSHKIFLFHKIFCPLYRSIKIL